jgi:hypothetical protein
VRLPQIAGEIERRLLVNYQVDPAALEGLLPAPFRPQLVEGAAVAGICLIRLGKIRPRWAPKPFGLTSENAAHRVAVEWDDDAGLRSGVFIPRRDTASLLTVLLGGRLFPGAHHHAKFKVVETHESLEVAFTSNDGDVTVDVEVRVERDLEGSRLFANVNEASKFFERGAVGFSPGRDGSRLESVQLSTHAWRVEPCRVLRAQSTFFEDATRFPPGAVRLDSALVMRKVPVIWDALPDVIASGV